MEVAEVSEIERVRFVILYQRVRKSRTKRFPCCNLFILYILRFSHQILLCEKSVSDFTSTNQRGETIFSRARNSFRLSDWSK